MAPRPELSERTQTLPLLRRASQDPNATAEGTFDIYIIFGVFTAVSTVALVLRVLARRLKSVKLFWDDLLVFVGWVLATAQGAMDCYGVAEGTSGRHQSTLGPERIREFYKVYYVFIVLQLTALSAAKLAVLIQLHRIFNIERRFKITLYVLDAIVVAHYFCSLFAYLFICLPIHSQWDLDVPRHCGNRLALILAVPIPWILTDFAIVVAPIPMVRTLKLSGFKKALIIALLLTGLATSIIACIRYKTLFSLDYTDMTWASVKVTIWSIIETNVTIACACIMVIKPAIQYLFPERFFSSAKSRFSKLKSAATARLGHATSNSSLIEKEKESFEHHPEQHHIARETRLTVTTSEGQRESDEDEELFKMGGLQAPTPAHARV